MREYVLVVDTLRVKVRLERKFKQGDEFRVDGQKCKVTGVAEHLTLPTFVTLEICDV